MKTNKNKNKAAMYNILSYMVFMVPMIITLMIIALPTLAMEYEVCKDILYCMGDPTWWTGIIAAEFMIIFPLGVWITCKIQDRIYKLNNNL